MQQATLPPGGLPAVGVIPGGVDVDRVRVVDDHLAGGQVQGGLGRAGRTLPGRGRRRRPGPRRWRSRPSRWRPASCRPPARPGAWGPGDGIRGYWVGFSCGSSPLWMHFGFWISWAPGPKVADAGTSLPSGPPSRRSRSGRGGASPPDPGCPAWDAWASPSQAWCRRGDPGTDRPAHGLPHPCRVLGAHQRQGSAPADAPGG